LSFEEIEKLSEEEIEAYLSLAKIATRRRLQGEKEGWDFVWEE